MRIADKIHIELFNFPTRHVTCPFWQRRRIKNQIHSDDTKWHFSTYRNVFHNACRSITIRWPHQRWYRICTIPQSDTMLLQHPKYKSSSSFNTWLCCCYVSYQAIPSSQVTLPLHVNLNRTQFHSLLFKYPVNFTEVPCMSLREYHSAEVPWPSVEWYSQRISFPVPSLKFKFVGKLRRDVLESDGRAGDSLESDPVEGQSRQLADLHLPLDEWVGRVVAVHTGEQVSLGLRVLTIVCI